ncbi:MAG: prephenate dehydratase [Actinomycetota bacterium]|nr:prephenate dehydratase [Actinomycetota bacterium]
MIPLACAKATVTFLGPSGTFTEEALRSGVDVSGARLQPMATWTDVMTAVGHAQVDYAFVALENSIEGTVGVTLDHLVFEQDLRIMGEMVLPVTQNLLTVPGAGRDGVRQVLSFPHAVAQCRGWLAANLPGATEGAATSTAEAARLVAEAGDPSVAAIGTRLAASLYGLTVEAERIEDHDDNVTRFVLIAPVSASIPAPTGHDKTSIVCFQSTNRPGSLQDILGHFSARNIDLVKLDSRPTKKGLGDYCFVIDFRGHVADEVVADCLKELHAATRKVKFLGSYPAGGADGVGIRRAAGQAWEAADAWIAEIRSHLAG